MPSHLFTVVFLLIFSWSFKANMIALDVPISNSRAVRSIQKHKTSDSLKRELRKNLIFFASHLLNGHRDVIQNYIRKYKSDTCGILTYKNSDLKADFEGVKAIKSIYLNKRPDTVFVIPPFNYCDEGESYCFYNKALPRLYSNSYCCHPNNLFVLPDIDEDGVGEIGIYYSSCTSRFKALHIYSLKGGRWVEIVSSTFDTFMKDPDKTRFGRLVRKVSKGKFKICDFMNGKTEWKTVVMKR